MQVERYGRPRPGDWARNRGRQASSSQVTLQIGQLLRATTERVETRVWSIAMCRLIHPTSLAWATSQFPTKQGSPGKDSQLWSRPQKLWSRGQKPVTHAG